jgi:hypothetical protein
VKADLPSPLTDNLSDTPHLIEPLNVIHTMIDLRAQVAELDLHSQALQPFSPSVYKYWAVHRCLNLTVIYTLQD